MHAENDSPASPSPPPEPDVDRFSLRQLMLGIGGLCAALAILVAGLGGFVLHAVFLVCAYLVSKQIWISCRIALAAVLFMACLEASEIDYINHWQGSWLVHALAIPIEIESEFSHGLDGGWFYRVFHFNGGELQCSRAVVYWGTLGAIFAFSALHSLAGKWREFRRFAYNDGPIDERQVKAERCPADDVD